MNKDISTFANGEFRLSVETHPEDGFRVEAPGLARALGFREAFDLLRTIPAEEKGSELVRTPGGDQQLGYLTEAGFYRALGQRQASRIKDELIRGKVERFQSWVYGEVLPTIRKTGSYTVTAAPVPELSEDEIVHRALQITSAKVTMLEAKVAEDAPKVDAYDSFMEADGTYSIGRVAKMLGRSQNKLFADLRNERVLIAKGHMHNTPYQQYMHHFQVTPYSYERRDGSIGCSYTTTVQPSGVEFIRRRLGVAPALMAVSS